MFQSFWGGAWRPGFSHAGLVAPEWCGEGPGLRVRTEGSAGTSVGCCAASLLPRASATCCVPWQSRCRPWISSELSNLCFILTLCARHTYNFNFIPWSPRVTKLASGSKDILQQCKVFFLKKTQTKPFYMSLSHHYSLQSLKLEYWISLFILIPLTLGAFWWLEEK